MIRVYFLFKTIKSKIQGETQDNYTGTIKARLDAWTSLSSNEIQAP